MKFPVRVSVIALLVFAMLPLSAADEDQGKRSIVVFNDDVDADEAAADLGKQHGVGADHVYKHALKGFAGDLKGSDKKIAGDPRVKYVVEDRIRTLPIEGQGKNANGKPAPQPPVQKIPTGIKRSGANESVLADIDGIDDRVDVDVAVIDTGVDLTHADLNASTSRQATFVGGTTNANDDHGHGSHVAGTVGALDNSIGAVGVAPGARIWAVKVLNRKGSGWDSDIAAGIDWVTARAATIEVANMSLGGPGTDQDSPDPIHDAIIGATNAGIVFVVAAGNSNKNAATDTPAAYDEVITVSALADSDGKGGHLGSATSYGPDDTLATFSNWGADVDIAASGVSIYSTYKSGGYATMSGTSMSSPHVAGAAALYLATHAKPTSNAEVEAVKAAILSAATPQSDPNGFTGDRDAFAEPLLNAKLLDGLTSSG